MYLRLCVLFCWFYSFARTQTTIEFIPTFQHKTVSFNQVFSDSIQLHALSYYVGQIELVHKDKVVKKYDAYHLLTLNDSSKTTISLNQLNNINFDGIRFLIGIDSTVIENGAMSGDLDPMNGHFWSWQSGYIHFKLEGELFEKPFTYHIGGASAPTNTLQTIYLPVALINQHITIEVAIDPMLAWLKKTNDLEIMSPSLTAVEFSTLFHQLFQTANR